MQLNNDTQLNEYSEKLNNLIKEKEANKSLYEKELKDTKDKNASLYTDNLSLNADNVSLKNILEILKNKISNSLIVLNKANKTEIDKKNIEDLVNDIIVETNTLFGNNNKLNTENNNLTEDLYDKESTIDELLKAINALKTTSSIQDKEESILLTKLSTLENDITAEINNIEKVLNEPNEPNEPKGSKEYNINNFMYKLDNNLFSNKHNFIKEAKYIIQEFNNNLDSNFDFNKFEQLGIEFLLQLKNFENILYKENNGYKDESLDRVEFLDMYDEFKQSVNLHISHNYKNVLTNKAVNELQNTLFDDKIHAVIIDNFKNIFYNIMLNNITPNTKIYKHIKREFKDFFATYFKDKKKINLYSDDLVYNIFYNFNKSFNKLFKNKLNIDYFNKLKNNINYEYFDNLQKNIMGSGTSYDIDESDQADNFLLSYKLINNNQYFIYFLIIINIFIFYILFKVIKALSKRLILPITNTPLFTEKIYI